MVEATRNLSPRWERRRERNRQMLRQAARAAFERGGYLGTSIDDIVAEADVARGTFYNYFQSKEEIFADLVREVVDELVEPVLHPTKDPSLRTRIETAITAMLETASRNRRFLAAVSQAIHVSEEHAKVWDELRARIEERGRRDYEGFARLGLAEPGRTALLATVLSGMTESALRAYSTRSDIDLSAMREAIVEILWRLLVRQSGPIDLVLRPDGKPEAIYEDGSRRRLAVSRSASQRKSARRRSRGGKR